MCARSDRNHDATARAYYLGERARDGRPRIRDAKITTCARILPARRHHNNVTRLLVGGHFRAPGRLKNC